MAVISDPIALKFVNEQVRPLCEQIRALKVLMVSAETQWDGGTNVFFANGADVVGDDPADGRSRLTALNVSQVMTIMSTLIVDINDQIIALPCVRPLTAS